MRLLLTSRGIPTDTLARPQKEGFIDEIINGDQPPEVLAENRLFGRII